MDNKDNMQTAELEAMEVVEEAAVAVAEAPVVKTKKELKKERKALKKHKKEVKKEAKKHSATATKAQNFFSAVISIVVIVAMLFCTYSAFTITKSINTDGTVAADSGNQGTGDTKTPPSDSSSGTQTNTPVSTNTPAPSEDSSSASTDSSGSGDTAAVAGDLSTKEGVVAYYKTAHAKVLSEAKAANHTFNNTVNYKDHLEIGGNSTLAGIAKSLMGQFMKEETNLATYTGADIAAKFPGKNVQNLTADMLSKAECVESGDKYIITLVVDSSDEAYDLGEKTGCVTDIIDEKAITDAAGSMVKLNGLENRYCGATVKATIDKATGHMLELESDCPSYMCFGEAKVAIISVKNVSLGLEYLQNWTIDW